MTTFTKNVLIQAAILGALVLFALWIKAGVLLLAFYGVMLAVFLFGKAVVWLINRVDAHLRRVYGPKPASDEPPAPRRWHDGFDDVV